MKKIAIDFGTTNTLIASFENEPVIHEIPNISKSLGSYSAVPSAAAYTETDGNLIKLIGEKALKHSESEHIFRNMKKYIAEKKDIPRKILGRKISHLQAGKDFLTYIINYLRYQYFEEEIDTIIFTVPVESFDRYRSWIGEIAETASVFNYRLLDESTAAALGYGAVFSPDYPYMIVDFGGGTCDVSIIRLSNITKENKVSVLGKGGADFGGSDIDFWLLQDFLSKNQLTINMIEHFYHKLITEIEMLKITLSEEHSNLIEIYDKKNEYTLSHEYSRVEFEKILKENNFNEMVQNALDNALDMAYENGIRKRDIKKIMLVGGSSQIPYFQEIIEQNFPGRVSKEEPFGAVIRGAANFMSGRIIEDFLHHHYALQYLDTGTGRYEYETIVPEKTKFPVKDIKILTAAGAFSGQTKFELKLFEIAEHQFTEEIIEDITYDANGNLIAVKKEKSASDGIRHIPLNPENPQFISIDPPSVKGQDRLHIKFSVDKNRMLTVTVQDLLTGKILLNDQIVAKLK